LVIASMVGSGVFTTSGFLLADLHTPGRVLLAWMAGGIIALFGALCYSALARRFPESGGEYLFLARTLHPAAGCLAGWVSLLVGFSAPLAAVALAFGEYVKDWGPLPDSRLTGSCLVLAFAALHALHVQSGAQVQNAAIFVKLVLMAFFIGLACIRLAPGPVTPSSAFPAADFAVALVWVSFSYSGWNAATYVAGEIREPERNLPRAMLLGTVVVTLLYLLLNTVFVFSAPVEALAGKLEVARIAAHAMGGAPLDHLVTVLITLALATSASSMLMAGPRVFARMADDGYLPALLRFPRSGPPRTAILLQATIALAMLWAMTFKGLLTYIGFTLGLCTAGAVVGLVRLRWREGESVRITGWPWLPWLFIAVVLTSSGFIIGRHPGESAIGLLTLGLSFAAWWIAHGRQNRQRLD
jgi:APA family basic amino acid/polyamine antiporter